MRFTLGRVKAKPVYRPFTEPPYRGSWPFPKPRGSGLTGSRLPAVYKYSVGARLWPSNVVAPYAVKRPYGTAVRAQTAFERVKGSTARAKPAVVRNGLIVSPAERLKRIERKSQEQINWRPKAQPQNLARFINTWGWDAFRAKVCEERRSRREVMHAKAIAGTRVARPTFDVRSMVRC